eukprot:tig00000430_g646.t1
MRPAPPRSPLTSLLESTERGSSDLSSARQAFTEILVRIKQVADVNALGLAYKKEVAVFETRINTQESGQILSYAKSTIALDLFMPDDAVPFTSGSVDVYWTVLLQGSIEDATDAPLEVEVPLTQAAVAAASKSRRSMAPSGSQADVKADPPPRRAPLPRTTSVIRTPQQRAEAEAKAKAEAEARAKEAKTAAEREAREAAEREAAKERAEREARRRAERNEREAAAASDREGSGTEDEGRGGGGGGGRSKRRIVSFGEGSEAEGGGGDVSDDPAPEPRTPKEGGRPGSAASLKSPSGKSLRLRRSASRSGSRKSLEAAKRGFSVKVNHEATSRRIKQSMPQSATRKSVIDGIPLNAKLSKTLGLVTLAAAAARAKKRADAAAAAGAADAAGDGGAGGAAGAGQAPAPPPPDEDGSKFKQAVRRVMYQRILVGRSDSMLSRGNNSIRGPGDRAAIMARARSDSIASSRGGGGGRPASGSLRVRSNGSLKGVVAAFVVGGARAASTPPRTRTVRIAGDAAAADDDAKSEGGKSEGAKSGRSEGSGARRAPGLPASASKAGSRRNLPTSPSRKGASPASAPGAGGAGGRPKSSKSLKGVSTTLLRFPLRSASKGEALKGSAGGADSPADSAASGAEDAESEGWRDGRGSAASLRKGPSGASLAAAVAASLAAAAPAPGPGGGAAEGGLLSTMSMSLGPEPLSPLADPLAPSPAAGPPASPSPSVPASKSMRAPRPLIVEPEDEDEDEEEGGEGAEGHGHEPPSPGGGVGGLLVPPGGGFLSVIAESERENVSVATARSMTPSPRGEPPPFSVPSSPGAGTQRRHVMAHPPPALSLPLPSVQPPIDLMLAVPPVSPSPSTPSPRAQRRPADGRDRFFFGSDASGASTLSAFAEGSASASASAPLSEPAPAPPSPGPGPAPRDFLSDLPPPSPPGTPPGRAAAAVGAAQAAREDRQRLRLRPGAAGEFEARPRLGRPRRPGVGPAPDRPAARARPQSARAASAGVGARPVATSAPSSRRASPERPRSAREPLPAPAPPPHFFMDDEEDGEEEEERALWLRAERRAAAVAWTAAGGPDRDAGRPRGARPAGAAMSAVRHRPGASGLLRTPLELWGAELYPSPRPPSAGAPRPARRPHSAGGAYDRRFTVDSSYPLFGS